MDIGQHKQLIKPKIIIQEVAIFSKTQNPEKDTKINFEKPTTFASGNSLKSDALPMSYGSVQIMTFKSTEYKFK